MRNKCRTGWGEASGDRVRRGEGFSAGVHACNLSMLLWRTQQAHWSTKVSELDGSLNIDFRNKWQVTVICKYIYGYMHWRGHGWVQVHTGHGACLNTGGQPWASVLMPHLCKTKSLCMLLCVPESSCLLSSCCRSTKSLDVHYHAWGFKLRSSHWHGKHLAYQAMLSAFDFCWVDSFQALTFWAQRHMQPHPGDDLAL